MTIFRVYFNANKANNLGAWRRAKSQRTIMTSDEAKNAETIVAICVSMSEETFIVGTDTKQLYSGTLTVAELQKSAEQV